MYTQSKIGDIDSKVSKLVAVKYTKQITLRGSLHTKSPGVATTAVINTNLRTNSTTGQKI